MLRVFSSDGRIRARQRGRVPASATHTRGPRWGFVIRQGSIGVLFSLFVFLPLLWTLMTSFKTEPASVAYPPGLWPHPFTLENYQTVFSYRPFLQQLSNSVIYSVGGALVAVITVTPAGYAATRFHFPAKRLLLLIILSTAMIPGVSLLVPTYFLLNRVGLLSSTAALVVIFAARIVPQTMWMVENFFEAVPLALEEAAFVDGAGRWDVLRLIVIPLSLPGLVAVFIFGVIYVWNDYVTVTALAPASARMTLQVALINQVFNSVGISWSFLTAFTVVSALPVLIIFLACQRWFESGLSAGALKG
jgi:multiple sugar transport system permease protein/N,N'-diacetylchitobiose transport system permease protein